MTNTALRDAMAKNGYGSFDQLADALHEYTPKLKDLPACAQTCAASAITFGDLNDPHSRVRTRTGDGRAYTLLDGLNLQPAITYLALQRRDRSSEDDVDGN